MTCACSFLCVNKTLLTSSTYYSCGHKTSRSDPVNMSCNNPLNSLTIAVLVLSCNHTNKNAYGLFSKKPALDLENVRHLQFGVTIYLASPLVDKKVLPSAPVMLCLLLQSRSRCSACNPSSTHVGLLHASDNDVTRARGPHHT